MLAKSKSSILQHSMKIPALLLLNVRLLDPQPGRNPDDLLILCACEHIICHVWAAQVVLRW